MFIRRALIRNIRSLPYLNWWLPTDVSSAGWHVIVGDNGTGKSSFLKAIGLGLVGPRDAQGLRQPWDQWLTHGASVAWVRLFLERDPVADKFSGKGNVAKSNEVEAWVRLKHEGVTVELAGGKGYRHLWGSGRGWFAASYGPFRRFRGGDPEYKKYFYSQPKLGRHLSLFDESVALSESIDWLKDLQFKKLEDDIDGDLLDPLMAFINQDGFLPYATRLTAITSTAVHFVDGKGATVDIDNLSDGYRSILSLTLELIRQLAQAFGPDKVFDKKKPNTVMPSGVVLIDEIDAHLHPTWQRRVGEWFRTRFPNIQFIVTTHSPIICQAANPGSVYRLPRPGTDEKGRFIKGDELKRLLYGSIEEAYGTEVFGDGITRSADSRKLLAELAALNLRELDQELTPDQKARLKELRTTLPTVAYTTANGK